MVDMENLLEGLFNIIRNTGSSSLLVCSVIVTILSQLIKVVFIPKLKIDLNNKFDPSVIIPFILGTIASVILELIAKENLLNTEVIYNVMVQGLTIGATATVIFRVFASLNPTSVKKLCKNELFGIIYNQMLLFGGGKTRLLERKQSMKQFVCEVQLIVDKVEQIYVQDAEAPTKRNKLVELMRGIVPDEIISSSIDALHSQLLITYKAKINN